MATAGNRSKKRRESYTLEFKLKVLEEVDKKRKKADICAQFGVPKSTLSTFISQRSKLEELQQDAGPKRKRARSAKHGSVDEAVLIWFKQCVAMNVPVNGPLKATELAREMDIVDWEPSDGWLHRFKHRYGLAFKTICGESATVTPEMVNKWHDETLPRLLERYDPSNIYNVDETGLFYQCLPNKTFTFRGQSASRAVKESKQRLTLLLGANMDGSDKIFQHATNTINRFCRLILFSSSNAIV